MATHVFALSLTWLAYYVARKYSNTEKYTFDNKKLDIRFSKSEVEKMLFDIVKEPLEFIEKLVEREKIFLH